jgi:8-oxo-dGTP diphosphatase
MTPDPERHQARLVTLAFVLHGDDVLLKRVGPGGDRFAGRWNGIGGHVEVGEDVRAAARRELREEAGLDVADLVLRGVIHEAGLLGHAHAVFLFVGTSARRAPLPEAGGCLAWHSLAKLGELPLVEDLEELLPRLLSAREVLFATERYDGADGRLELVVEGERIERV